MQSTRNYKINHCDVHITLYNDSPVKNGLICRSCNTRDTITRICRYTEEEDIYRYLCEDCTYKFYLMDSNMDKVKSGLGILKIKGFL